MTLTVVLIVSFLLILGAVFFAVSFGFKMIEVQRQKKVIGMMNTVAQNTQGTGERRVRIERPIDTASPVQEALADLHIAQTLEQRLEQAGLSWKPANVLITMAGLAVLGGFIGFKLNFLIFPLISAMGFATFFGLLPWFYVAHARGKRIAEIEKLFPDALDFLSRSMRAGHAFSVSLDMLGKEAMEPLGFEIRRVFNEQNLGIDLNVALRNLAKRLPLLDVRFFVSAVLLQKDTGGNLAEILTNLGYIIRERFKLRGHVRAISAHGRLTAMILTLMPVCLAAALMFVQPDYLQGLVDDPDGRYLATSSVLCLFLGYFFIRKIVNIRV